MHIVANKSMEFQSTYDFGYDVDNAYEPFAYTQISQLKYTNIFFAIILKMTKSFQSTLETLHPFHIVIPLGNLTHCHLLA